MSSLFEEYPAAAASTSAAGTAAASISSAGAAAAYTSCAGAAEASTSAAGAAEASTSFAGAAEASTSFAGAAAASTSFAGAGEASNSANGSTKTSYDVAGVTIVPVYSDDDDDIPLAEMYPELQNSRNAQREIDLLQAEFTEAVKAYGLRPGFGIRRRTDFNYDLCMAALDNVLNRHIEATHPSEERIEFIKAMMNRFYQVMVIWVAETLRD